MSISTLAADLDTTKYFQFGFDNLAIGMDEKNDLRIYCDGWIYLITADKTNEYYDMCTCYKNNNWVPWSGNWAPLSGLSDLLIGTYNWTSEEVSKLDSLGLKYAGLTEIILQENEFSKIDCDIMCGNGNVEGLDELSSAKKATPIMAWVVNEYKDLFLSETSWNADGTYNRDEANKEVSLPTLTYKASKKWYMKLANDFMRYRLIFSWDYNEMSPYKEKPDNYKIQIIAFLNGSSDNSPYQQFSNPDTWYWIEKGTDGGYLSKNEYSFSLEDTVNRIRDKFDVPVVADNILLQVYIRTIEPSTGAVSKWHGISISNPCGAPDIVPMTFPDDGSAEENNIDTSEMDYDNGGYHKDSNSSDDASGSKSSDNYVDPSELNAADNLIITLKTLITSLGQIPQLFAMLCTWIPTEIISLISVGIGLIVIVGIVKWVL